MFEVELQKYRDAISVERKADIVLNPYKFKGLGRHDSECKIEIWKDADKAVILFTDIGKGTSVTNASEQLVTEIYNKYLLNYDKKNLMFIETYQKRKNVIESADVVVPIWDGNEASDVNWFHLGKLI